MKLTLPLPPNRANAREHWRVTHRNKVEYYEKARNAILLELVNNVEWTGDCTERMRLDATCHLWKKMDRGNLVARLKWIEDILVKTGLLVDDNEEWLDLQMPKQVIDRKEQRVEIILTPCGELWRQVDGVWEYIGATNGD